MPNKFVICIYLVGSLINSAIDQTTLETDKAHSVTLIHAISEYPFYLDLWRPARLVIPFLAEFMEDSDGEVERWTQYLQEHLGEDSILMLH
jgi:hypothetical protein